MLQMYSEPWVEATPFILLAIIVLIAFLWLTKPPR